MKGLKDLELVIFAGGYGSRLSELTEQVPKPLVEIGDIPIIMHIMRYYSKFGVKSFIICAGYKYHKFNEYFCSLHARSNNLMINYSEECPYDSAEKSYWEDWKIRVVNTGLGTPTGGRLSMIAPYLKDSRFLLTYGDGLSNIDLNLLLEQHIRQKNRHGAMVTLSAVIPPARYGIIEIDEHSMVTSFVEKKTSTATINGGFFVVEKDAIEDIVNENSDFEIDILPYLAKANKLSTYKHNGFWQSMDTLRDKKMLDELWKENKAPWRIW